MGWQDRDYAREPQYGARRPIGYGGGSLRSHSVAVIIIWINVAIYVLCIITAGAGRGMLESRIFRFGVMNSELVMHGQIWRLVTSDYLHWSTWHIFLNMLGLYFLGRPVERVWGGKKFFAVYTIAGIIGSVFYLVLTWVGWLPANGIAAGASGCVLGLLGAAAVLFPHAEVWIYFLFPVKIRILAIVFAGIYVFNVFQRGPNAGGDACHLAGLAFGVWYAMKGDRWWANKGRRVLSGIAGRTGGASRPESDGFRQRMEQRRTDAATVDRILGKVRREGIGSLSDQERRALNEATTRQRMRERESGGDW
jgi:membrane associated rhomboid family serine protease